MASYKTEAIILSRINLGEADRILTIFSKHFGKLRVLAKGVRRATSRKAGSLEPFGQVKLVLAKGKNLDIITEVETIRSHRTWRQNLVKVGVAFYLVELVDQLTAEGQKSRQLYQQLVRALSKIGRDHLGELIRQFEEEILAESGFGVPEHLKSQPGSLADYIEQVIEKSLKSKEVLQKIKYG